MNEFLIVNDEFRRQWNDDESLDRHLSDINEAAKRFQIAYAARNGHGTLLRPIMLHMFPSLLPPLVTCNCGSHPLAPLYHRSDCPAASRVRKACTDPLCLGDCGLPQVAKQEETA